MTTPRPANCPSGKLWYGSEAEARTALQKLLVKGKRLREYKCDRCNGYHLSSQRVHGPHAVA